MGRLIMKKSLFSIFFQTRTLYKQLMIKMGNLLLQDAGLADSLSPEELKTTLLQFAEDAYAIEKEVAYVSNSE